jgi:Dynein heavy chain, N-terminal region 2
MPQIRDALRTRISPTLTPQELFDTLVSIKRAALRYHSRKARLSLLCDRASEALPRLRRELLHLPAAETQLARATAVLTELVTEVPSVELRIAPLLKAQIPRLRGDIQKVESEMAAYRASVSSDTAAAARAYTQWGAGAEAAEQELSQAEARHHTEWTSKLDKVRLAVYHVLTSIRAVHLLTCIVAQPLLNEVQLVTLGLMLLMLCALHCTDSACCHALHVGHVIACTTSYMHNVIKAFVQPLTSHLMMYALLTLWYFAQVDALAQMFGISSDLAPARVHLAAAAETFEAFRQLWQCASICEASIAFASALQWSAVEPAALEDIARDLSARVRRVPAAEAASHAGLGLSAWVQQFTTACPLAAALRHAPMQTRHWQMLLTECEKRRSAATAAATATAASAAGDRGTDSDDDTDEQQQQQRALVAEESDSWTLAMVLGLQLPAVAGTVYAVLARASLEHKHGELLRQLEQTWSNIQFVTAVCESEESAVAESQQSMPLLQLSEVDKETLESDLVTVQVTLMFDVLLNSYDMHFRHIAHTLAFTHVYASTSSSTNTVLLNRVCFAGSLTLQV